MRTKKIAKHMTNIFYSMIHHSQPQTLVIINFISGGCKILTTMVQSPSSQLSLSI